MNPIPEHQTNPSFPLQELDQVEATLRACDELSATLRKRHQMLIEELDRLTAPQYARPVSRPQIIRRGYEYRGTYFQCVSSIDIYTKLLKQLWEDFPDHRESMATTISARGISCRYIARSPQELFTGRPLANIGRYSRVLIDGWYMDTNLNDTQKRQILVTASKVVGLTWDLDIKVNWRPRIAYGGRLIQG